VTNSLPECKNGDLFKGSPYQFEFIKNKKEGINK